MLTLVAPERLMLSLNPARGAGSSGSSCGWKGVSSTYEIRPARLSDDCLRSGKAADPDCDDTVLQLGIAYETMMVHWLKTVAARTAARS